MNFQRIKANNMNSFTCAIWLIGLLMFTSGVPASAAEDNSTAILQPSPDLVEFKNASFIEDTHDVDDLPMPCPLKSSDFAAKDLQAVETACDASQFNGNPNTAGSSFCTECGCRLDILAWNSLQSSKAINGTSGAEDDLLDACSQWTFGQALRQGAISKDAATVLSACAPIVFICPKYSQYLNASMIKQDLADKFSVLGGGIQDAVQNAAAGAPLPGAPIVPNSAWKVGSKLTGVVLMLSVFVAALWP